MCWSRPTLNHLFQFYFKFYVFILNIILRIYFKKQTSEIFIAFGFILVEIILKKKFK